MIQHEHGLPTYLENSPSGVCDQIIWLIKNSNLNFQLKETPFSLGVSIKKRFVNQWSSPPSPNCRNVNAEPVLQSGSFPPHSPLHEFQQHPHEQLQPYNQQENYNLIKQVESLRASYDEAKIDNDDTLKNYAVLDKAFKKLVTENKVLQKKHEKTVLELKTLKNDNETVEKQKNSLSVALKSCKKDAEASLKKYDKEINEYKAELEKLIELNSVAEDEAKKAKRAEKKIRQKKKKEISEKLQESSEVADEELDAFAVDTEVNVAVANQFSCLNPTSLTDCNDYKNQRKDTKAGNCAALTNDKENNLNIAPVTPCNFPSILDQAPPTVSSTSWSSSQRIQCDQCDRKCVNKRDMECHIFLWHSDYKPRNVDFDVM